MRLSLIRFAYLILLLLTVASCASRQQVTFQPQPIVQTSNDSSPIPQPEHRDYNRYAYGLNQLINRQLDDLIDPLPPPQAMNVNALSQVPNSSWFTNRIGREYWTGNQVAAGPTEGIESPELHKPWTVLDYEIRESHCTMGISDASGRRFTLLLDPWEAPEAYTSAEIITSRLLYAAGYNTYPSFVTYFSLNDIVSSGDSAYVNAFLTHVYHTRDNLYRAAAILLPDGIDCGPSPPSGLRKDDPNDRIPHEHRRELRALRVFASWIGLDKVTPDAIRDIYEGGSSGSFLTHYVSDLSLSFGTSEHDYPDNNPGFEYADIDMKEIGSDIFTFGLSDDRWSDLKRGNESLYGAYYESASFDPSAWKPLVPVPYMSQMTPQDAFWAATLIASFGDDHIASAVRSAEITSNATVQYLIDVLKGRREKILGWAFRRVCPIEGPDLEFKRQGLVLKFTNLAEKHRVVDGDDIEYTVKVSNVDGSGANEFTVQPRSSYIVPTKNLDLTGTEKYIILEISMTELSSKAHTPPIRAHFYGGEGSGFELIGIERLSY